MKKLLTFLLAMVCLLSCCQISDTGGNINLEETRTVINTTYDQTDPRNARLAITQIYGDRDAFHRRRPLMINDRK
jgi:hypothetical protein